LERDIDLKPSDRKGALKDHPKLFTTVISVQYFTNHTKYVLDLGDSCEFCYFCLMRSVTALQKCHAKHREPSLFGRDVVYTDIAPLIAALPSLFHTTVLGHSEKGLPIHRIDYGIGDRKILLWSQMHGNETTGTKALFDLFRWLASDDPAAKRIYNGCTLLCIPMLNPDGAALHTRKNARGIDLNRDAIDRKAVESQLLRACLDDFAPDFCFNLHDQRAIFNVEGTANPATLSFLAPSVDVARSLTAGRKETMSVIVAMNELLQQLIPNHIGRYTDEFYPTATGDNFQRLGHNTILVEAGHFPHDLDRERTREFNFYALLRGLEYLADNQVFDQYEAYFNIPNNALKYLNTIYKNLSIERDGQLQTTDVGVHTTFKRQNGQLVPHQCIEETGDLSSYFSDTVVNAENIQYQDLKLSNS
jgi:hypothetical protein